MPTPTLFDQSLTTLAKQIESGSLSPVTLTESVFERIEQLESKLNAFKLVTKEQALACAKAAERQIAQGHYLGPLHGIPYVAKDLYDVKGLPTTAGCSLLEDNVARTDSAVVHALRQAGAILVGKTHTVQFAYGGVGINHDQGTPHNPWHVEPHVPGGSSSGTAVAVSSGIVPMGLGTDTGGSVRIPAALCGITGLKTTVGQISRRGVYPLSWSLDSVGPLARSVEDCALTYQAIQGADEDGDETTAHQKPHDVLSLLKKGVKHLRIHFAESVFWDDVDPEVESAVRKTSDVFQAEGAIVESIPFEAAKEALALNQRGLIISAEGYAVNQKMVEAHGDQLDPIVGTRLVNGIKETGPAYFMTTRKWAALRKQVIRDLSDVDALIVPTTAMPALPVDLVDQDIETYSRYNIKYLRNTSIGNILNLCAVSVPCGLTQAGLPIGLMIYAKPFHEDMALRIAYTYEQASGFSQLKPNLDWITHA